MKSKKLPLQRYKNILNKKIVGYVLHIKFKVLYLLHETFIFIAQPEKSTCRSVHLGCLV